MVHVPKHQDENTTPRRKHRPNKRNNGSGISFKTKHDPLAKESSILISRKIDISHFNNTMNRCRNNINTSK